jgi:hypothetical protein
MTQLDEDGLVALLHDAVDEPPHPIAAADVRTRAVHGRRRTVAAVAVLALVLASVGAVTAWWSTHRHVVPATPLGAVCPTLPPLRDPIRLPAGYNAAVVISCRAALVRRPGQGWWLEITEQHAVIGAAAYGRALQVQTPPVGCPSGGPVLQPYRPPALVADKRGHVVHAAVPYICHDVNPAVTAAVSALVWQDARVVSAVQMVTETDATSPCLASWRQGLADPWFVGFNIDPKGNPSLQASVGAAICIVRSARPGGPRPDDLVEARRLTGANAKDAVTALSATPGWTGPDPSGQAPLGDATRCAGRTVAAWAAYTAGRLVGYIDLGACMRAVGPDLQPANADLKYIAFTAIGLGP